MPPEDACGILFGAVLVAVDRAGPAQHEHLHVLPKRDAASVPAEWSESVGGACEMSSASLSLCCSSSLRVEVRVSHVSEVR